MRRAILTAPYAPPGPFALVTSFVPASGATGVGVGGVVATGSKVYFSWILNGTTYVSVLDADTQIMIMSFTVPSGYSVAALAVNSTSVGVLLKSSSANDIFWAISTSGDAISGSQTLTYSGGGSLAANVGAGTFCVANGTTAQVINQSGATVNTATLPAAAQGVVSCGSYFYVEYSNASVRVFSASTGAAVTTLSVSQGSGSIYTNGVNVYLPNNSLTLAVGVISGTTVSSLPLGTVGSEYAFGDAVSASYFYLSYAKGEGGDHIVPIELPSGTVDSSLPELAYFGSFLGVFDEFLYATGYDGGGATSVAVYDSTNANTLIAFKTTSSYISGLAIANGKAFAIGSGSSIDVYTAPTRPLSGVNIGDPFMGGFYAGIIDTTKSNIIAADASQTGLRYALIVAPASLENSNGVAYKTTADAAPSAASTRWDGLTATAAMNSATYPAAQYCAGLSYDPDGASAWYLPAMDELELIYRNLRCSTESNWTTTQTATFPGTQPQGYNPSSDPTGAAYTSSDPGQTSVAAFKTSGTQALGVSGTTVLYWSATESTTGQAWVQYLSGTATGAQISGGKTGLSRVRPVRRLILS